MVVNNETYSISKEDKLKNLKVKNLDILGTSKSVASPTATAALEGSLLKATFTGFTTAAAASQVFTITNSKLTTDSVILCSVCNQGSNDAQMTVTRQLLAAGSVAVTLKNNGAAALNGDVIITVLLL